MHSAKSTKSSKSPKCDVLDTPDSGRASVDAESDTSVMVRPSCQHSSGWAFTSCLCPSLRAIHAHHPLDYLKLGLSPCSHFGSLHSSPHLASTSASIAAASPSHFSFADTIPPTFLASLPSAQHHLAAVLHQSMRN